MGKRNRLRWVFRLGRGSLLTALAGVGLQSGCMSPRQAIPATPALSGNAAVAEREIPHPQSAKMCMTLAADLEKNGHDLEAAAEYEKAREYDPKLQVARRLGLIYERLGDFHRAQVEYELALKEHPKSAVVLNDIGYLCYSRGRWDDAEKALRDAVAANPKYPRAWINLGMTLGQKGEYAESLNAFRHACSEGEAHSNLGFVLMTQGKRQEAKQAYREALNHDPDLNQARLALANLENPKLPASTPSPTTENAPGAPGNVSQVGYQPDAKTPR